MGINCRALLISNVVSKTQARRQCKQSNGASKRACLDDFLHGDYEVGVLESDRLARRQSLEVGIRVLRAVAIRRAQ